MHFEWELHGFCGKGVVPIEAGGELQAPLVFPLNVPEATLALPQS